MLPSLSTDTGRVTITFRSSKSIHKYGYGFKLQYFVRDLSSTCGGVLKTGDEYQSPGYPKFAPKMAQCVYVFHPPPSVSGNLAIMFDQYQLAENNRMFGRVIMGKTSGREITDTMVLDTGNHPTAMTRNLLVKTASVAILNFTSIVNNPEKFIFNVSFSADVKKQFLGQSFYILIVTYTVPETWFGVPYGELSVSSQTDSKYGGIGWDGAIYPEYAQDSRGNSPNGSFTNSFWKMVRG
ncbi:uncharacterized protein [Littorina saxatilis]|uniref:uncharacterized protein n=1 Tax=Littorina saxatilis TaxID=31220 RepID=UPI0038B52753